MPAELDSEEVVTQLGSVDHKFPNVWHKPQLRFQSLLRDTDTDGMSCLRGRLDVATAALAVGAGARGLDPSDAVRYVKVGDLADKGFQVLHTPGPDVPEQHVSISWSRGEDWDAAVGELFSRTFREYVLQEGTNVG